ncbi:hypothetical protein [Sphingomonas bacterium]|uniref:beta strand repeat-containing protein n=1 Tax=Sphingomonas bacterium TaxID=1895847 RepID=UPI0026029B8E|nr:hypothetical protein [Sphingomonas bacterium]
MMLRLSCAAGALIASGYAFPAAAQGYQGNPTVINGGVTIVRTPGHDQITIDSATAVIDWSSFNPSPVGPLDFLPAANSVNYLGTQANYTVLNRIVPNAAVPIMLNGAITSQVAGAAQPVTGGSIWFYTLGGFMVGSTATFNVGGLLLSANDIPLNSNNDFNPNVARFVGRVGSTSEVNIAAGAKIAALNYVALIAPRIVQSGSIRADGQIAYIAAETGTLTMPLGDGLFSIAIDAGGGTTVGGTAIVHDGSTGGPVTPGSALNKRIYMVTVAKNNAVTMLLGGAIGYDLSAAAVGNTVVLSAGRDVINGDAVMTGAAAGPAASIQLINGKLTTPLIASASGDITLLGQGAGTLSLSGNTLAVADGTVTARATTGTINASGNLTLQSARFGLDAGTAQVIADKGGQINIKGALNVLADGDGVRRGYKTGGSATGGVASVSADGGSITANTLTVSATGVAQPTSLGPVTSRGGTASVLLANGASLNVGPIVIDASAGVGPGGTVLNDPTFVGAAAIGGTASLTVDNAVFAPTAPLTITARALGGSGQAGGGAATGGTVLIQSINGGALTLPGLSIDVTGTGGASAGGAGGAGQGGGATVRAQNGAITIADLAGPQALTINAQGRGGTGTGGVVGSTGGTILVAANGAPLSAGTTSLLVDGNAGGSGGTASLTAADAGGASGSMTLGDTTLSANGGNGGKIALTNTSTAASPAMRLASLNASALGAVVAGGSSFALSAQGNRIAVTGNATILTGGDQTYAASGGGGFTVGNTLLATAGGAVSLVHTGNAGAVDTVNAGDADMRAQSISVGAGAILGATRSIRLNAVTTIDAATLRAGTSADATAGTTATIGNATAGTSLNVAAGTAATLNNATAGTALTLTGDSTATLGNGTAGTTLTVIGGTTVTLGNGTAGTAINATGQTIAVNGTLRSPQIAFRSAAMQIGGASQIGGAGLTQNVSFTNTGAGASFIGGVGGAGYSLTNAGLGRVQSRDITIVLPGDTTVGALALTGAAGAAPVNLGGTFSITTPGTVTVNGAVALTGATAANALTFNAGPAVRVITRTGSIALLSTTGAPAGTLTLNAATVAVASQAALTDIAAATDVSARNARLAVNDGPVNDQGYLTAGAMRFSVTAGLYIQNSGAVSALLTARRGFTVGDGGVTISTLGGQRVGIVINGRQLLANGTIITGAPLIPRITLNNGAGGAALFDPQSTVNGCKIIPGVCPGNFVIPKTLVGIRDTIGLVNGGTGPASAVNGIIPPIILPALGIEGLDPYSVEPPIDEPVIGIGNEDVWSDGTKP